MDVRGGNEGVNPGALCVLQRLPGPIDVLVPGPAQASNGNPIPDILRNHLDGLKIIRRRDRETCFHNIDPEPRQLSSELQLFSRVHAVSGRLLSVPQCGIKN